MARAFAKAFYRSKEWSQVRQYVLIRDKYLCRNCGAPAEEVHHIKHLTPDNIWDASVSLNPDNLVSLCRDCHFAVHKRDIAEGVARSNRERARRRILREDGTYFDENGMLVMRKVYLVYGSPRAGKTTFVREHMEDGDCVIDLDAILAALRLTEKRRKNDNLLGLAIDIRDYLYSELERKSESYDCKHVWIIGGFPGRGEREELCARLNAEPVYISAPQKECERRAIKTNEYGDADYSVYVVRNWWNRYQP